MATIAERISPVTTETIEAVYEHGSFRPIAPVGMNLTEGQKVRLMVEQIDNLDDILGLAGQVYEGLNDQQIDSIEQHIRRRENFFGERPSG
jgi:predicted DNA-binding antitoxin AbrB/MazE fold protein